MEKENIRSLEKLSAYTYFCGLLNIFLGLMIILMKIFARDFHEIQHGIFILITGYAFFKTSGKITAITNFEKNKLEQQEIKIENALHNPLWDGKIE